MRTFAFALAASVGTAAAVCPHGTVAWGRTFDNTPTNLAEDNNGTIYISDYFAHKVSKHAAGSNTAVYVGTGGYGTALGQYQYPWGLSVDAQQNLLVSEWGSFRVSNYAPGQATPTPRYPGTPARVAMAITAPNGHVFVADYHNSRVLIWNGLSFSVASTNNRCPYGLELDDAGFLLVAETCAHMISQWVPGAPSRQRIAAGRYNSYGSSLDRLGNPRGMFFDRDDRSLYIADVSNHRIMKYDYHHQSQYGVVVAGGCGSGSGLNQMRNPHDVYIQKGPHGGKFMYVTDFSNKRVLKWTHRRGTTAAPPSRCDQRCISLNGQGSVCRPRRHSSRRQSRRSSRRHSHDHDAEEEDVLEDETSDDVALVDVSDEPETTGTAGDDADDYKKAQTEIASDDKSDDSSSFLEEDADEEDADEDEEEGSPHSRHSRNVCTRGATGRGGQPCGRGCGNGHSHHHF